MRHFLHQVFSSHAMHGHDFNRGHGGRHGHGRGEYRGDERGYEQHHGHRGHHFHDGDHAGRGGDYGRGYADGGGRGERGDFYFRGGERMSRGGERGHDGRGGRGYDHADGRGGFHFHDGDRMGRGGERGHGGRGGRGYDNADGRGGLHFHGGDRMGRGGERGHGGRGHGGSDGGGNFMRGRKFSSDDLQLLLLALLAERPSHGYELIKALHTRTEGFYSPSPGMVYPALTYIEELGYAEVTLDGNKKSYSLSPAGVAYLASMQARVDELFAGLAYMAQKMKYFRGAVSEESGGEEGSGWLSILVEARRALKRALLMKSEAGHEEQQRIAAILTRAADEINKS